MEQTITVVFTNHKLEHIVANSMKKYIFNYTGYMILRVGDIIVDNNYSQPMQIVKIDSGITQKTPSGIKVKLLNIDKFISGNCGFEPKVETRTFNLDINTARQWYLGNDESLQKIALQVYKEEELIDITSLVNKSSVCINIPDSVSSEKYHILAELEAYAEYFNNKSPQQDFRYSLVNNPCCRPINECIYIHTEIYHPGIVYFNKKEDLITTIKFMGKKLNHLF